MCDTTGHRLLLIGTEITTSEFMKATSLPPHTHTHKSLQTLYKQHTILSSVDDGETHLIVKGT